MGSRFVLTCSYVRTWDGLAIPQISRREEASVAIPAPYFCGILSLRRAGSESWLHIVCDSLLKNVGVLLCSSAGLGKNSCTHFPCLI